MEKGNLTLPELVEKIKQDIPKNYNTREKIAFIEVAVAKNMAFDERYLWGNNNDRVKIQELANQPKEQLNPQNRKRLIGPTMTERFGYVLKNLGFNIRYQGHTSQGELVDSETFGEATQQCLTNICVQVESSDNYWMPVDISRDLSALQTSSLPGSFGTIHSKFDETKLRETFRKVYGLEENEKFLNEHIFSTAWKLKLSGTKPIEIMQALLADSRISAQFKNLECVEAQQLYEAILAASYDESRDGKEFYSPYRHKAFIDECILSDGENKKYSFCIYAEDEEQKLLYVYSKKSKKLIELTPEEARAMKSKFNGDITLRKGKTPLLEKLSTYLNGKSADEQTSSNNIPTIEDIFEEPDDDFYLGV